jgi:hypothetical protein
MVTVALRLILNKEEFPNEIIEEFAKANTIRNNIIHEAKTNVSREDVQNGIIYDVYHSSKNIRILIVTKRHQLKIDPFT